MDDYDMHKMILHTKFVMNRNVTLAVLYTKQNIPKKMWDNVSLQLWNNEKKKKKSFRWKTGSFEVEK